MGKALGRLALALFVFWVLADHPHDTFALDDLALLTHFLNRCTNLHSVPSMARQRGNKAAHPTICTGTEFDRGSDRTETSRRAPGRPAKS
jgi:hypothetical protein